MEYQREIFIFDFAQISLFHPIKNFLHTFSNHKHSRQKTGQGGGCKFQISMENPSESPDLTILFFILPEQLLELHSQLAARRCRRKKSLRSSIKVCATQLNQYLVTSINQNIIILLLSPKNHKQSFSSATNDFALSKLFKSNSWTCRKRL